MRSSVRSRLAPPSPPRLPRLRGDLDRVCDRFRRLLSRSLAIDIVKEGSARHLQCFQGRLDEEHRLAILSNKAQACGRCGSDRSSDLERRPRPRAWVLLRTIKRIRASDGCLGVERRRRTWHAAISSGEVRAPFDPEISEWGNPPLRPSTSGCSFGCGRVWSVVQRYSRAEYIGLIERTRGTETSQYP